MKIPMVEKNVLLIVDLQKDFLPGGALPAPEGNLIIPVINRLSGMFERVIASKDWHPANTVHFERWPPHCIRDSEGASFPEDFEDHHVDKIFLKGTGPGDYGYSAFEATNEDLDSFLKANGIIDLFLVGLTAEYCVKATAFDAIEKGYQVTVIRDAVAGVNANPGDTEEAFRVMQLRGARLIGSENLLTG
jgi:nicotinamidase/pyrazinamidase